MKTCTYILLPVVVLFLFLFTSHCKISYSFSGASISPEVSTVAVDYFQNRAEQVNPRLASNITNTLKDKIQSQTDLYLTNNSADVSFMGEITGYSTKPVQIRGNDRAAKNRLTIRIRVKYRNTVKPDKNFDKTFSRYEDYESNKQLSEVEGELVEEIVDQLTEDIFNAAFVNW